MAVVARPVEWSHPARGVGSCVEDQDGLCGLHGADGSPGSCCVGAGRGRERAYVVGVERLFGGALGGGSDRSAAVSDFGSGGG